MSRETSGATMLETLQAQQELLRKLYADLDEEREASASAASEALSMILRLQGEKAAVKMEASQYRRLAEEKICHAEDSLEALEDLLHQREMEIASLGFQVRAYECKFLSLGDINTPENNNNNNNKNKEIVCFEGSQRDLGSYLDQIRDLDEQVKEISHCDFDTISTSDSSTSSFGRESEAVQDIFEVPKLDESVCENKSGKVLEESHGLLLKPGLECNNNNNNKAVIVYSVPGLVDSRVEFERLRERVERLEGERVESIQSEEEKRLLVEIQKQLSEIRDEIRGLKEERETPPPKKKQDDQQVHCLKEAMLHFWF